MTGDGVNNYSWDARNHLASISASGGGTIATFQYDPFGRRIKNSVGNGVLYDGSNDVQELSGSTPVANRLTGGIDEFFNRADSTGAFTPLTDALGSTVALTDSTGAIQTQYTYEPFGNTTASGPASTNAFQYTGRENDGTGVYFYRARYYSPIYQRFISEDPLGFGGGDANFYIYAGDSPANFGDPLGLDKDHNWNPWGGGNAGSGSAGAGSGSTLGVRAPGQTYANCLAQNAGNYSAGGIIGNDNFLLGNDVANLLFGDADEAGLLLSGGAGGSRSFAAGVGTVGTYGRRTATVFDLNLAGRTGPAPRILAKTGAEKIAGALSGIAEAKLALDVGLTGAEVIGCLIPR